MDDANLDPRRQLAREKALYRYRRALERADFATAAEVLREAQRDERLERMIIELHETLAATKVQRVTPAIAREPATTSASRPRDQARGLKMYDLGAAGPHTGPGMSGSLRRVEQHRADGDQEYSDHVETVLTAAYRSMESSNTAASDPVTFGELYEVLREPMAPTQRLRVYYVTGLARIRAREYYEALPCLDGAIALVHAHGSQGDLADLLYVRAGARREVGQIESAAADLRACLKLLHALNDGSSADDVAFELAVLTRLAEVEFWLAQHAEAEEHLEMARRLLPQAPKARLAGAKVEWIQALIHRWRGQPELALRLAAVATDVASSFSDRDTTIQLNMVVADVCLDLAERLTTRADRDAFTTMAHAHIEQADKLAFKFHDEVSRQLIELIRVRHRRLSQHRLPDFESQIAAVEQVIRFAQGSDDQAMLARALTAIGDVFAAHGDMEQALACYRAALEHVARTQMPALGVWARRALHNAHEMRE